MAGVIRADHLEKIASARILLVGAGGIGCEVLKCLVQSGFKNIEIIDMDTIDISNLNRQFLFRKEHVGKAKSEVARASILQHYPDVNINALVGSIIDPEKGVSWFRQFVVVINALDNIAARVHVNRMCLAAEVPLIESGTKGYAGQAELIVKGLTKCYECEPKDKPTTFPNCTIRNTPSEPIHCIVWSKNLFNQLFGEEDEFGEDNVSPDTEDPEATGGAGNAALVPNSGDGLMKRKSTREWAIECNYDAKKLFNKFFFEDIEYLLSLHDLWKKRKAPSSLKYERAIEITDDLVTNGVSSSNDACLNAQRTWSLKECVEVFCNSVVELQKKWVKVQNSNEKYLIWDKDDKYAMEFVASCSNIRSFIFGIERKSLYDIKSMAGNIIPAIATANAMVGSLVVIKAVNIVSGRMNACKTVYLRREPNHRGEIISAEDDLLPPVPNCYICSLNPEITLTLDPKKVTLKQLQEDILKKTLNVVEPEVTVSATSTIILTSEDDEDENKDELNARLNRPLSDFNVNDGTLLYVDDFVQTCKFNIRVIEKVASGDEREAQLFELTKHAAIKQEEVEENGDNDNFVVTETNYDCDPVVVSDTDNDDDHVVVTDTNDDDDVVIMDDDVVVMDTSNDNDEQKNQDDTVTTGVGVENGNAARGGVLVSHSVGDEDDDDDDLIVVEPTEEVGDATATSSVNEVAEGDEATTMSSVKRKLDTDNNDDEMCSTPEKKIKV